MPANLAANAAGISAIVSASMLLGSAFVFCFSSINAKVQAIFQNLSAGILLAAIAGELFPILTEDLHNGWPADVGLVLGFVIALLVLFGIKKIVDKFEEDAEKEEQPDTAPIQPKDGPTSPESAELKEKPVLNGSSGSAQVGDGGQTTSTEADQTIAGDLDRMDGIVAHLQEHLKRSAPNRFSLDRHVHELHHHIDNTRRHMRGEEQALPDVAKEKLGQSLDQLKTTIATLRKDLGQQSNPDDVERQLADLEQLTYNMEASYEGWKPPVRYTRWSKIAAQPPPPDVIEHISWSLVICVAIDAGVDGFLIGLAYAVSPHAGYIMAAATCIEMGFLGLSFSATLRHTTKRMWLHVLLILLPPAILAALGAVGGALGGGLRAYQGVFVGFIAFCVVALLFLVTQELLVEAHENQNGAEIWWINMWIFVGVLLVLLVEKHLK